MNIKDELWVMLEDKPIYSEKYPDEIIDYEHEVVDIIDYKHRKVMTMEGHVFDLDTVNLSNAY
jgi:hypothetical protein